MTRLFDLPGGIEGKIIAVVCLAAAAGALIYAVMRLPEIMARLNGG